MTEKDYEAAKKAHDNVISHIWELDKRFDSLSPFELAKLEYLYTRAERYAWRIAGYFKSQYRYYEGMAEVSQGTTYKSLRDAKDDNNKSTHSSIDAQYESRIAKGNMLTEAGGYEGEFTSWKGWANSYEGSRLAIKDMIKSVSVEGGN